MTSSAPPFPPLRPNDPKSVGEYRTVGRLGSGGMGSVYAGVDGSGTLVAIKLVHGDLAVDREFRARFHREASLVQRVTSPCVPKLLASDTRAPQPWLVTEYAAGPTLRQHVIDQGPMGGANLRVFAVGVVEALRAIHTAGIVHRDLKPGNVILSPDGPKVLDFGIARALDETAITRTGGLFGTPGWVAPELLRGAPPSAAADVFAWGELVAYAATGRAPFGTGSAETIALRVLEGEPDLDGVPEDLLPLVAAATDRDPTRRPAVSRLLTDLLSGLPQPSSDSGVGSVEEATTLVTRVIRNDWQAPPLPGSAAPSPAPARGPSRRPWLLVPAAVAALLLVVGGGWFAGTRLGGTGAGPGPGSSTAAQEGTGQDDGRGGGGGDGREVGDGVGELAVSVSGNGLLTLLADGSGALDVSEGLDGTSYVLPDGAERAEYAVATVRVNTVYADAEAQSGILLSGEVAYLTDSGELTLRSTDFTLYEVGEDLDPLPDDPSTDGRAGHVSGSGDVLAVLTPDSPEAEFELAFPDAPPSGLLVYLPGPDARGDADGTAQGAYLCYMNWHPLPPVDMADGEYTPCPEEPPA